MTKIMLDVLSGKPTLTIPLWMMRQAGRYLPEYREVRAKAGSFLNLCYNPELAYEVTMQPIRRFNFDGSILFSDILVVPHALGRNLIFEEGRGPLMTPIQPREISKLQTDGAINRLSASFETLKLLKKGLPSETTLIGFCGAPWTVATYMIAGHSTPDQGPARLFFYENEQAMIELLNILADISADYLIGQIEAGADCVQIFDSWAGVLDEASFEICCVAPVKRMVERIREKFPDTPIIGFPKGAGFLYKDYSKKTGVTALSLDWCVPLSFAQELQEIIPVQGNLDPYRLLSGGKALEDGVKMIRESLEGKPFIFNLGHGISKDTPIFHVEELVKFVRKSR